jgi:PIN domain nuclease of toxin-antitoxin system
VNGYLLDTNAVLIALTEPQKLSSTARRAIKTGPNSVSAVSYWEVLLKSMKGTLDVGDPRMWWREALDQLAATVLPLRPDHLDEVYGLPPHKDPFDRVLIAQAVVEGLVMVTTDKDIRRYSGAAFKVV